MYNGNLFLAFSDGAGRSGVYLAIDANIELSEEDGVFDIYGYLKKMRQQRRGLVESLVRQSVTACTPYLIRSQRKCYGQSPAT